MRIVETAAKKLSIPEFAEASEGIDKADQRAGDETSEVWISADLGNDQTKRRESECQEDLSFVAGVKALLGEAKAAKTKGGTG